MRVGNARRIADTPGLAHFRPAAGHPDRRRLPRLLIVIELQEAPAQPAKRNAGQWNGSDIPNIPVNERADESERNGSEKEDKGLHVRRFRHGASSPSGESAATPLRDFHVAVARGDRTVSVCVRDHECEDGDRVRIDVNGRAVFSGEIVNAWACRSVPVSAGRNSIELYAINGTGRKGNCSYADENTGQIRVEGLGVDTQGWKHRGGAGSRANLMVTVR